MYYTSENHTQKGPYRSPNPFCHFAFTYLNYTFIKINQNVSEWLCEKLNKYSLYRKRGKTR